MGGGWGRTEEDPRANCTRHRGPFRQGTPDVPNSTLWLPEPLSPSGCKDPAAAAPAATQTHQEPRLGFGQSQAAGCRAAGPVRHLRARRGLWPRARRPRRPCEAKAAPRLGMRRADPQGLVPPRPHTRPRSSGGKPGPAGKAGPCLKELMMLCKTSFWNDRKHRNETEKPRH